MRIDKTAILFACVLVAAGCSSKDGAEPGGGGRTATFDAVHAFTIEVPEGARTLQAWFAMPDRDDPHQDVLDWRVDAPYPTRVVRDGHGNEFLYMDGRNPRAGGVRVVTRFRLRRQEVNAPTDPAATRPHTDEEKAALARYLSGSSQSVIDEDARRMAAEAAGDERNPIAASRAIYDAILDHVEYHVKDPKPDSQKTMKASGLGSSTHAYEECTGNCTDIHSLYAAVSRAAGIPTRLVYGSFFKGPLYGKDRDQSYHCWIEFHAPDVGWVPLDVAVADVFVPGFEANEHSRPRAHLTVADGYHGPDPGLVDYYFGNLDRRRVVWHRGRDLVMRDPRQSGDPLLWNPKAYVEVDGRPHGELTRKLTYVEVE